MISTPMVPGVAPETVSSVASLRFETAEALEEEQPSNSFPGCVIEARWPVVVNCCRDPTPTAAPAAVIPSP